MSGKHSRPATIDDLKLLLKALNDNDVQYMLIGGYARATHGYVRATTDIDILVPANRDDGVKLIRALMVLPDQAARDIQPEWFAQGENIRVADAFVVDVRLNANGHTCETLSSHAETTWLDEIPVRTLDLQGLLLTKQTMRDKDIADRHIIERALAAIGKQQDHAVKQVQAQTKPSRRRDRPAR